MSTLWILGLMGYFGFKMTAVGISLPALMIAVGSSYSIHILNQYYADLDKTNIDELNKFLSKHVSSEFVLHLPGGMEIKGIAGLQEYYTNSMSAFKDGNHTIDETIEEENKIAFRATASAIHKGVFMGIPPTGQKFTTSFAGFWKVKNKKIVEWWSEYDALGMMLQLGMELKMKEDKE